MLYLDYAKQTENGYIMNFFANSVEDLEDISEGKEFVTKNGTNYGVPAPQSVVTITNKDGEKTTYLMGEDGNWIPGVVNPTDYYTKKQADEKFAGKEEVETISQDVGTLDGEVAALETNLNNKQDKITKNTELSLKEIQLDSLSYTIEIGSNSNEYDYGILFASKNVVSTGQLKPSFVDETFFEWVLPAKSGTLATTDDIKTGITIQDVAADDVGFAKKIRFSIGYETPTVGGNGEFTMPNPKLKTLFGNQSIVGEGNIDLYKHHIHVEGRPTGNFYIDFISSKNLVVSSLADLKTLLGDTFKISAYGDYNSLPVLYMSESTLYYLENGDTNSIELSTPKLFYTDTVTTI